MWVHCYRFVLSRARINGDAKYFTNQVLYQFFRFRSFFFRPFSFRFFQFFVKFQISIGHGWGGRHGRTERHGRAPAVANWNLKFFKLGLESSKTAGTRLKTIRNDPKTVRNRPKTVRNRPKPSKTVRNRPKTIRNRPKIVRNRPKSLGKYLVSPLLSFAANGHDIRNVGLQM